MKHTSKILIQGLNNGKGRVCNNFFALSISYDKGASDSMRHAGRGEQSPKNKTTKAPGKLRPETGHGWRGIMNDSCVPSLPANMP